MPRFFSQRFANSIGSLPYPSFPKIASLSQPANQSTSSFTKTAKEPKEPDTLSMYRKAASINFIVAVKPRERLVESALILFCKNGFHSTGIDLILAESKVAKTTLYKYFRSKDELILATLRKQDEDFRNRLMQVIDKRKDISPLDKLLTVFDFYEEWSKEPDFNGCAFVKASAEFPDLNSPIHALCIEHKRLVTIFLKKLLEAAYIEEAKTVANQLMTILEGATILAQINRNSDVFIDSKKLARKMIVEEGSKFK